MIAARKYFVLQGAKQILFYLIKIEYICIFFISY